MAFEDRSLTCVDCKTPFTFSARDQEFHAQKGFTNEPKRCPACRQARRAQRGEAPAAAGAQNRSAQPVYTGPRAQPRAGGRNERDRGGPRGRRDRFERGPRHDSERGEPSGQRSFGGDGGQATYMATCSACGKETPAPADAGNRVVFCAECYEKMTALTRS